MAGTSSRPIASRMASLDEPACNSNYTPRWFKIIQPQYRLKADNPDAGTVSGVRSTESRLKGLPSLLSKSGKAINYLKNLPRDVARPLLAERNPFVSSNAPSTASTLSCMLTLIFNLKTWTGKAHS